MLFISSLVFSFLLTKPNQVMDFVPLWCDLSNVYNLLTKAESFRGLKMNLLWWSPQNQHGFVSDLN
jgi:hypothetical protein